jgi:hypothetical protein
MISVVTCGVHTRKIVTALASLASLASGMTPSLVAASSHTDPLPPGFKLHNDARSLCAQVGDDFILEAASGRIEDNNPAPSDRPLQRNPNTGGFIKFKLKAAIDRIERLSLGTAEIVTGGENEFEGGKVISITCHGTIVMHGNNARISGTIIFMRWSNYKTLNINRTLLSWGADSIYDMVYRDGQPLKDASGKFVEPPPRPEWGTFTDWGYPDQNP